MATNAERPKTGRIELHSWRDFTKVMKVMGAGKWIYVDSLYCNERIAGL